MTHFKMTLLRTAAVSMLVLAGLHSAPASAQCANGSDFGNRGVCNESPAQNLPQQPAPDVVQPQPQQAPAAQPGRGGGRQGNNQRNNNQNYGNNNRGYDNRGYDNRGYDNRGYDNRGYDNRGYDNRGGYYSNQGYDYRPAPAYPGYPAPSYPTYEYQQGYGYPAADPYNNGVMSEEQLAYSLQQQGFSRIETVDYATGQYTVDARDQNNRSVRLRVSGQTGQILEARAR